MRRLLVTLILGVFLASAAGCADLGISNPFESTPTAASSQLLGISLPAGMELSTQHCARTTGSDGQPQGMETAYGQADRMQVAQSLFNNMQGAFMATRYLCEKGHKHVGYLKSKVPINNFLERKDGYKKALKACDVPYEPEMTFLLGSTVEMAYFDMKAHLARAPQLPTAFFADNDNIAIGAMRALKEAGYRIPEDVSVVGFDDIPFCELIDPPMSTVRVPKQAIGRMAVDRLVTRLDQDPQERIKIEVHTDLVERASVCSPTR